jgi:co-chaperonin GroES (HSP10)
MSLSAPSDKTNGEVQGIYGRIVRVRSVADESLKLADFEPARHNIAVEPLPPDQASKGGIVLPSMAQADKSVGWVVAVHRDEAEYQVGDLVYYRFGGGQQIKIEGRDIVMLNHLQDISDILGRWPAGKVQPVEPSEPVEPDTSMDSQSGGDSPESA